MVQLQIQTRAFGSPRVSLDFSGRYIIFEDSAQERLNLSQCQVALKGKDLFPSHASSCFVHFDPRTFSSQAANELDARPSSSHSTGGSMSMSIISSSFDG